jgi:hypothetical protein
MKNTILDRIILSAVLTVVTAFLLLDIVIISSHFLNKKDIELKATNALSTISFYYN